MNTRIYTYKDLDKLHVQQDIKTTILEGKNIVFPTETVYGIGGHALSKDGIQGIYSVKGRPSDNPLILHVSSTSDIDRYVTKIEPYAYKLMEHFWPGPMTLVMKKSEIVPPFITGGLDTIGIRIPGSEVARKVIEIAGVPICAPSANISGRPSSTLVQHVIDDFMNKVDIIIDGGKSDIGLESTVIDVTGEIPVILRPGMISSEMIKKVVGNVDTNVFVSSDEVPKAPGMKYKHYAPKGDLTIIDGEHSKIIDYINDQMTFAKQKGLKVGVLTPTEYAEWFHVDEVFVVGDMNDSKTIAANLFEGLRRMDSLEIDIIFSFAFYQGDMKDAIMNRLLKAANNQIITL